MIKTDFIIGPSKYSTGGRLYVSRYGLGSGIALIVRQDGEAAPEYVATVNMTRFSHAPLAANEVWLKGWSENEGVPEALEAAGVLMLTDEKIPAGFAEAVLGMLSDKLMKVIG